MADATGLSGLSGALSVAMAPTKQRRRVHDRGDVLVDLAVMLADGGETISDLSVLGHQPALFGEVASIPTARRTLEAVDAAVLDRLNAGRAEARKTAWAAGADPGFYVIDRNGARLAALAKDLSAPAQQVGVVVGDLLDAEASKSVATAAQAWRGADILVSNVGPL